MFCTSGPNLVIPAWTLNGWRVITIITQWHRQACDWHTQTHTQMQTTIPEGQNRPQVKTKQDTVTFIRDKRIMLLLSKSKSMSNSDPLHCLPMLVSGLDMPACPGHVDSVLGHINFCSYVPDRASDSSVWARTYFPSNIHKLYRACRNIGWAHENFCRARKFLEPHAQWACEPKA